MGTIGDVVARTVTLALAASVALLSGCGSSGRHATPTTTAGPPPTTAPPATAATAAPTPSQTTASALQAEANSAAAGDVPDNQVYVVFHDVAAGYSIKYPEGWAQKGAGSAVTFRDKNNVVRIVVAPRRPVTAGAVRSSLRGAQVTNGPAALRIGGAHVLKVVYTTRSAPNTVTGKRVTLTVDRYYVPHARKEAIVDLGSPVGVDNVDAYRLMIESFRWR